MDLDILKTIIALGEKTGHIIITTADRHGKPHVGVAGKISIENKGCISVTSWFCPGTLENLEENPHISIVVWEAEEDIGYQLIGVLQRIENISMLNGFSSDIEVQKPIPQVERRIVIEVKKVLDFSHAPHSDIKYSLKPGPIKPAYFFF